MTVIELVRELMKYPEDAEVSIEDGLHVWEFDPTALVLINQETLYITAYEPDGRRE